MAAISDHYCERFHSLTISQAIHGEILFSEASLKEKHELKEENSKTDLSCRLGRYIDNLLVPGTEMKKVMCAYNGVWERLR